MPIEPQNREIPQSRSPGRPPASAPRQPEQDAKVDTTQRHVPPLTCPICGRGMVPRVERWKDDGSAACMCSLSGCRFIYTPAKVRAK